MSYGAGSIEHRKGGYRVTIYVAGKRVRVAAATLAEAESIREGRLDLARSGAIETGGTTLAAYGERQLDLRELRGVRSIGTDRSRWSVHVAGDEIGAWPLESLTRPAVRAWTDRLRAHGLALASARNALILLRVVLDAACEDELLALNPARGVKIRSSGETHDAWTYLTPDEQHAIETCDAPEPDRLRALFALYTGMRQGEQWNLELGDVHHDDDEPHVVVRYGSRGGPTKGGRLRRVPLLPSALAVVRRWLELLPTYARANPHGLLWPTPRGARRQKSWTYGWHELLHTAGIERHVRWHDLRHTCASSLIAGWWGRPWRIEEVRAMLGHSSVTVTERYAHMAPSALAAAAAETRIAPESPQPRGPRGIKTLQKQRLRGEDLNLRPSGYEPCGISSHGAAMGAVGGALGAIQLAEALLRAQARGDVSEQRIATELAEAVLAAGRRLAPVARRA